MRYATIERFPGYRFGDDGTIWTQWRKRGGRNTLEVYRSESWRLCGSTATSSNGYRIVSLKLHGGPPQRNLAVHRLILEAFCGACPEGQEACHNNGVRNDNRIDNLRWGSRSENFLDKRRHGTHSCGERASKAKLTNSQARDIRRLAAEGMSQNQLARMFGVAQSAIWSILHNRTYRKEVCS